MPYHAFNVGQRGRDAVYARHSRASSITSTSTGEELSRRFRGFHTGEYMEEGPDTALFNSVVSTYARFGGLYPTDRHGEEVCTTIYGTCEIEPSGSNTEFNRLLETIKRNVGRPWLLRRSVYYTSNEERDQILKYFTADVCNRRSGFRLASDHPTSESSTQRSHLHLVHDCAFHHGQCRCAFMSRINGVQLPKFRVRTECVTIQDIGRLVFYHCQEGRKLLYLITANTKQRIPHTNEVLQGVGCSGYTTTEAMGESICGFENIDNWGESDTPRCGQPSEKRIRLSPEARGKVFKVQKELDDMLDWFKNYTVVPLEHTVFSSWWQNSPFKYEGNGSQNVQKVMNLFRMQVGRMSLHALELFWDNQVVKYWDTDEYRVTVKPYLPLDESVKLAEKFLFHQFQSEEAIYEFLFFLSKMLNKETGKMNAIEVVSPPTSGKNWFFDSIMTFCISYGHIENHSSKNSRFTLENAINRRINIYNEPNFDAAFEETLLKLTAGDTVSAEAKYQSYQSLVKTPIVILSNVSKFGKTSKWNERLYRVRWHKAEMLKDKDYCHPLTFVSLLNQKKIKFT